MLSKFLFLFIFILFCFVVAYPRIFGSKMDFDPNISLQLVKNGAILIDVRSETEYKQGHIKGAVNIPHHEIKKNISKITELIKNDEQYIVVYCKSGQRASIAKKKLMSLGLKNIVNHGSISSWKSSP